MHQHFYDHFYGADHAYLMANVPITFMSEIGSSDSLIRQEYWKLILKTMTPLMAPFCSY